MNPLLETVELLYDDLLVTEMANLQPKTTGLVHTVNIMSKGGAKHGPRVKVSNVAGKWAHDDNFTLTLEPDPRVIGTCKLKPEHLEAVKDWIQLNRKHLVKVWNDTGTMDYDDIGKDLKRI